MDCAVYILTNKRNGTLYIGVTSNLTKRMYQHKNGLLDGFTKKYQTKKLVHYEPTSDIMSAIQREKQLKNWRRKWKIELIEKQNPNWQDLSKDFLDLDDVDSGSSANELDSGFHLRMDPE